MIGMMKRTVRSFETVPSFFIRTITPVNNKPV